LLIIVINFYLCISEPQLTHLPQQSLLLQPQILHFSNHIFNLVNSLFICLLPPTITFIHMVSYLIFFIRNFISKIFHDDFYYSLRSPFVTSLLIIVKLVQLYFQPLDKLKSFYTSITCTEHQQIAIIIRYLG